jgi:hypothetical protein
MQSSASQATLARSVTGCKCDVQGCYDIALWKVSRGDESFHWCAKHTRVSMRDAERWNRVRAQAPATDFSGLS